jgi:hypothetical protein
VLAGQEGCDVLALASVSMHGWLLVGGASPKVNLAIISVPSEAPDNHALSRNEANYSAVRSSAQGILVIRPQLNPIGRDIAMRST